LTDFAGFRGFARRTIPRRFSKEEIGLITFTTKTNNDRNFGNDILINQIMKTKILFVLFAIELLTACELNYDRIRG